MVERLSYSRKRKVNMSQQPKHSQINFAIFAFVGMMMGCFFFSLIAYALPSDSEQTMQITSDSTLINYKTGVNTYEGKVKKNQGTTHLIADRLITKNNAQHKTVEAIDYSIKQLEEYSTIP